MGAGQKYGVAVGAHIGFPDLLGFGRRPMLITAEDTRDYVVYQAGALRAFVECADIRLHHVGPHGALAGVGRKEEELAKAFVDGVRDVDPELIVLGRPDLPTYDVAKQKGMRVTSQLGLDINYNPDKTAVVEREKKPVAPEEAVRRAIRYLGEGKIMAVDGIMMEFRVDTFLVHGDTPNAIDVCKMVRAELEKAGVEITSFGSFV
jgi:UPF0271 protein